MRTLLLLLSLILAHASGWLFATPPLEPDPLARFQFEGPMARRIEANCRNWLVPAPAANPGMLGMFRLRDRQPGPNLVPWAGEFVGKYLISAVQAMRMTDDEELEATVRTVVAELIASQADDGYLGPFPKSSRLLGHWDLWGHYHVILGLLAWHEHTGDPAALQAALKAADMVCDTYLDTDRRVFDAGSHEMNMAIIHAMAVLHRKTGNPRYLKMARHVEEDWQRAGDYFRTGLAGVEFFRTPRPRWESLHDLQGLAELYRITGEPCYRTALVNHWQSIRRFDRRNSGAFSSGEQADGNPYRPSAIETCCTIAWMAMTVDVLRLTGNPAAADELELPTWNLVRAAQHPSGRWWTYDTPMSGARAASAHSIVFQARPGTPELNCCSVNAPRGLGVLSEWAVMRAGDGLAVNYYGPMKATIDLADGTPVALSQQTDYPAGGRIRLAVSPDEPSEFAVRLRIPAWSRRSTVRLPGAERVLATSGTYFEIRREWQPGDEVQLDFDMRLRYESGDLEAFGRMSVYRGPLLLAYDVQHNPFDESEIPVLTPAALAKARVSFPAPDADRERIGQFAPLLFVDLPVAEGRTLRLCDFGTAGSTGSRYVSWLPAEQIAPPAPVPDHPPNGSAVPPGPMIFSWRRPAAEADARTHKVVVVPELGFDGPVFEVAGGSGHRVVVPATLASQLEPDTIYRWKVIATNPHGTTESRTPAKSFRIDPDLPPLDPSALSEYGEGPDGLLTAADLAGDPCASFGSLARATGWKPAPGVDDGENGAVELDGRSGMLVYGLRRFPSRQYTVSVWVNPIRQPEKVGQVVSAWARGMDDPLRICIQEGKLFARIEAGQPYSSDGVPIEFDRWIHVAAVKDGGNLALYVDGKPAATLSVPAEVRSAAVEFALGGNPHYTAESEHLACRLAKLRFYVRPLNAKEIAELVKQ